MGKRGRKKYVFPPQEAADTASTNTGWENKPLAERVVEAPEPVGCIKCGSPHKKTRSSRERPRLGLVIRYVKCLECGQCYVIKDKLIAKSEAAYAKLKENER